MIKLSEPELLRFSLLYDDFNSELQVLCHLTGNVLPNDTDLNFPSTLAES